MLQRIKNKLAIFSAALFLLLPMMSPAIANAASPNPEQAVCGGAQDLQIPNDAGTGTACPSGTTGTDTFNHLLTLIINIFSVIVGVIAVVMIIVGGFRYITSGGKQESVGSAKNTILYALIGLVVVALAQIIVRFVLNKATTA